MRLLKSVIVGAHSTTESKRSSRWSNDPHFTSPVIEPRSGLQCCTSLEDKVSSDPPSVNDVKYKHALRVIFVRNRDRCRPITIHRPHGMIVGPEPVYMGMGRHHVCAIRRLASLKMAPCCRMTSLGHRERTGNIACQSIG